VLGEGDLSRDLWDLDLGEVGDLWELRFGDWDLSRDLWDLDLGEGGDLWELRLIGEGDLRNLRIPEVVSNLSLGGDLG